MEILIRDFASNSSLNKFEVCLIEQGRIISSVNNLIFLEVIFRVNNLINQFKLNNKDKIVYKLYDEQQNEINTVPLTIGKFRGLTP